MSEEYPEYGEEAGEAAFQEQYGALVWLTNPIRRDADEAFQKRYPGFITEDLVLSNLTEEETRNMYYRLKALQLAELASLPPWKVTFDKVRELMNVEAKVMALLFRGRHGFERRWLATSARMVITEKPGGWLGGGGGGRGGFLRRIFGRG